MIATALLFLLVGGCQGTVGVFQPNQPAQEIPAQADGGEISGLLSQLHSKDQKTRSRAKKALINLANASFQSRRLVIQELIKILNDANSLSEAGLYSTWYDAAELLGRFKATEAIDTLVRYLDFTDGVYGLSVANRPAVKALVQMGEPAVPRLIDALSEGKPSIRMNAAESLGLIKTNEAKSALARALVTETDTTVLAEIKRALYSISNGRQ